ncbi:MAG: PKD domain-containing protein [Ferruginibacter sp.]
MKKILIAFLVTGFLLNGCKKGNEVSSPSTDPVKPAAKPTAAFKITNLVSSGKILEGNITDFDNQSANGDTYLWDFGNGITSGKMIPTDISFSPCGGYYTISLTVKNKAGDAARYSQDFTIMCRGKNAHNKPVVHIRTSEIPAYVAANE